MSYTFRPAVRESVGLLIGLTGPSGCGKTYSAMRIASGIVGPDNPFAVIDTESRRALHYADIFKFDHAELCPPFRPDNYAEIIKAAVDGGYKAIVVDSASHEWAGEGGILDWQEEDLARMVENAKKKGSNSSEYQLRESMKMASWIKPKMSHKQMVQRLLQVNCHLILCFRAEEKVKMEKDQHGKTQIVPMGFQPICSKELPYELTVSFLMTADKPGMPIPLKLQEQHRAIFPLDKQLNEESGMAITEWAAGGVKKSGPQIVNKDELNLIVGYQKVSDKTVEDMKVWLKDHGFKSSKEVTTDKLQELLKWISETNPKPKDLPDPPLPDKPDSFMVSCPNEDGAEQSLGYCRSVCTRRHGCPAVEG